MNKEPDISNIIISLYIPERARCDIQLLPSRVYYYFATTDTREDGELPITKDDFEKLIKVIKTVSSNSAFTKNKFDYSLTIEYNDKTTVKYDNVTKPIDNILDIVETTEQLSDELLFLQWFY